METTQTCFASQSRNATRITGSQVSAFWHTTRKCARARVTAYIRKSLHFVRIALRSGVFVFVVCEEDMLMEIIVPVGRSWSCHTAEATQDSAADIGASTVPVPNCNPRNKRQDRSAQTSSHPLLMVSDKLGVMSPSCGG